MRYKWLCGGVTGPPESLNTEQRKQDYQARLTISLELGHVREQISAFYLGR
jgi:hypothetical protein